jgi:hypothetical protein
MKAAKFEAFLEKRNKFGRRRKHIPGRGAFCSKEIVRTTTAWIGPFSRIN